MIKEIVLMDANLSPHHLLYFEEYQGPRFQVPSDQF